MCQTDPQSSHHKPITLLTRETVKWEWPDANTAAFNAIKISIIDKAMGHFNKLWNTSLFCYASPVGLGCILWSNDTPNRRRKVWRLSGLVKKMKST